ncbi:hypothetical protein [Candidatus Poriferisocius sp.]|uniref:hypothetical protein n=1 Tax=Candidatus Poriferisocius sp. TaxID=3101276 RepID=UPI003B01775B
MNVDFTGAQGNTTTLLLRREAAELQARYIAHVDGRAFDEQPLGGSLWIGISAYTNSVWREFYAPTKQGFWRRCLSASNSHRYIDALALASYLNADLDFNVEIGHVERWLQQLEPARTALVYALGEGDNLESSSECVLLAVPFMPFRPQGIEDIDLLVEEFVGAVDRMDLTTLQVVAEYGRRWEAIIDTTVPVDQSCLIKLSEQRPWLRAHSSKMEQELAWGDARTTHVEIRAADHGIVIDKPQISDLLGQRLGVAAGDSVPATADTVAFYASDPKRPYFARISVRAHTRQAHSLLVLWILVLILAATTVAGLLPDNADLVESLALLTFPLTLAGALVLSRGSTPLTERLLRHWKVVLVLAITVLWAFALFRLLLNADVV